MANSSEAGAEQGELSTHSLRGCAKTRSQPVLFNAVLGEGRRQGSICYLFIVVDSFGVLMEFGVQVSSLFEAAVRSSVTRLVSRLIKLGRKVPLY